MFILAPFDLREAKLMHGKEDRHHLSQKIPLGLNLMDQTN